MSGDSANNNKLIKTYRMKIEGKIIAALDEQRGVSKSGKEWRRMEYVIETPGEFPKKCVFSVMGDNIEKFGLRIGQDVDIEIDIDAREYNGRWFNSITCWKAVLRNVEAVQNVQQIQTPDQPQQPKGIIEQIKQNNGGDLPF